jgi:signal transduction histidine kinase
MSVWRRPVAWFKAHPFVADSLLAVFVTAVSVPALWHTPSASDPVVYRDPSVLGFLLLVCANLPVAWRRRNPMLVVGLTFVPAVLYESLGFPGANGPWGALIALYTVAAHCDRRRSYTALGAAAVGVVVVMSTARFTATPGNIVSNVVVFGTAWLIGENLKTRRAFVASLEERAEQAEATRVEEARRAVAEERTRIARELHDVVAHSMSVMIVQAGAARRVLDTQPAQARDALVSIESTGREAMSEMRRLLGVLRDEGESPATRVPQPTVADLHALVEPCAEAGLAVTVEVQGVVCDLPPGVDLSAYRIVQEALTNVRKHAGPASAEVVLRYGDDALDIEVCDDGRGAGADVRDGDDDGHGLIGMRERVEMFGGDLRVGPRAGGGFAVHAHLPFDGVRA